MSLDDDDEAIVECGCCTQYPEHKDETPQYCNADTWPVPNPLSCLDVDDGTDIDMVNNNFCSDGTDGKPAKVWYCYMDVKKNKIERKCGNPYENEIDLEKGDFFTSCGEDCKP